MNNIHTVNVIKIEDTDDMYMTVFKSFPETKEGNQEAEAFFKTLVRRERPNVTDDAIAEALDDGEFLVSQITISRRHCILITHST